MSLPKMQIYLYGRDGLLATNNTYQADIHLGEKIICHDSDGLSIVVVAREIIHDPSRNEQIIWTEQWNPL